MLQINQFSVVTFTLGKGGGGGGGMAIVTHL